MTWPRSSISPSWTSGQQTATYTFHTSASCWVCGATRIENQVNKDCTKMAKKKNQFYAVAVGRTPGIYNSWDDCKVQVQYSVQCYCSVLFSSVLWWYMTPTTTTYYSLHVILRVDGWIQGCQIQEFRNERRGTGLCWTVQHSSPRAECMYHGCTTCRQTTKEYRYPSQACHYHTLWWWFSWKPGFRWSWCSNDTLRNLKRNECHRTFTPSLLLFRVATSHQQWSRVSWNAVSPRRSTQTS